MNLKPDTIISHYKILSEIGKGGMGEVYLARDNKLERKVAVKMLTHECCEDSEKLVRFVQEAKTASALNHPNILTIFEFGSHNDSHYMASEFVDGQELSQLIVEGNMSVDRILDISLQIASALRTAHQAGIVHRDIKPENIMVRRDGIVKILDFGLAKLAPNANRDEADNPRLKKRKSLTSPGMVLGTPNYMSPEQTRGRQLDGRTDIWSFGVVLFELLTGRLPFDGETVSDVIASILHKEPPPLSKFVDRCPDSLQKIISTSLEKSVENRYQNIEDLASDLKEIKLQTEIAGETDWYLPDNKTDSPATASFEEMVTRSQPAAANISTVSKGGKEALVLTEFNNQAGDSVFDGTLKMALAFTLEQSPFIEIFPDSKVRDTLKLMGHPADKTISCKLAKEVCQRRGLKAYIAGAITKLGSTYVLTLEAISAQTDEVIGRGLEQANSKEDVLRALGKAATTLREQLGEELNSIKKFDAPLELTTSSLEALQVFTLGYEEYVNGKNFDAIPFYKQAVKLDPDFAFAYIELAALHYNTEQPKQAVEYVKKAYELKDRVSEFERSRIEMFYHAHVTGDQIRVLERLGIHKKTYPKDFRVSAYLSDRYIFLGEFEKAAAEAKEAIRLNRHALVGHWNLMQSLIGLNRFEEVKDFYRNEIRPYFEKSIWASRFLYQIALIEKDKEAMDRQLSSLKDASNTHTATNLLAITYAIERNQEKSTVYSQRAINQAKESQTMEIAAQYASELALRLVLWKSEPDEKIIQIGHDALRLASNKVALTRVALAFALQGLVSETMDLITRLEQDNPQDTLINGLWLPTIRAAMDLKKGRFSSALKLLEKSERYQRAGEFYPRYIRAIAHSQLDRKDEMTRDFEYILNHRGEAPYSIIPALIADRTSFN